MNVTGFKLINGDEIIGDERPPSQEDQYIIKRPLLIGMAQGQNGQPQLMLADYLVLSKEDSLYLKKSAVMFTYVPKDALTNQYVQMTTGIAIPNASAPGKLLLS